MRVVGGGDNWQEPHSRARAIALDRVSATERGLSLKTRLFLAVQILHRIQGASWPAATPVGGKLFLVTSSIHILLNSIDSLYSILGITGADDQICFAKVQ